MGYSGIIVTDHFYNGNCAVPRNIPWKEWVNRFCHGYEEAREEGERQGLDVFFGWEETFNGCDDYLIYGLDKEWLLEHPEVINWTRAQQYSAVRAAGGCVVQAHPFRQHFYIKRVILSTGCVDGVEAANAGNFEQAYDALALRYAQKINKTPTAGTDIHDASGICCGELFGVYFNKKLKSIADFVAAIRNNEVAGLKTVQGQCDYHGDESVSLPVVIKGENDITMNKNWKNFI